MLRQLVGERVEFATHLTDLLPVLADRGQLEQVLMNLAINARDAMPSGGRLTVETSMVDVGAERVLVPGLRPGRYVMLAMTDTGTGMDADTVQRIFDPFFTTKGDDKGTGLGLTIVHGIITRAGGAVTVYSEPGQGTVFRVHLPVATATIAEPALETGDAPATLPAMTVLVVDDDREVREVASRILQRAGCSVLQAASARAPSASRSPTKDRSSSRFSMSCSPTVATTPSSINFVSYGRTSTSF